MFDTDVVGRSDIATQRVVQEGNPVSATQEEKPQPQFRVLEGQEGLIGFSVQVYATPSARGSVKDCSWCRVYIGPHM